MYQFISHPAFCACCGNGIIEIEALSWKKFLKFDYDNQPMLAHRLDKDTSGLLMLARTREAARILGEGFKERIIKKKY